MSTHQPQSAQLESETHTIGEAARRLGIGRTLAYRLVAEGQFPVPTIKIGRRVVVPRLALDRLFAGESNDSPK